MSRIEFDQLAVNCSPGSRFLVRIIHPRNFFSAIFNGQKRRVAKEHSERDNNILPSVVGGNIGQLFATGSVGLIFEPGMICIQFSSVGQNGFRETIEILPEQSVCV